MTKRRGVLTIATNHPRYAEQAVALARSIRLRDPNLPLAVATNLPAGLFCGMYDIVVPFDSSGYPGLLSKLLVYDVSPFDETLFLDADCLAVRSLEEIFTFFGGREFAVYGRNWKEPMWANGIVDRLQAVASVETLPTFNGGLVYFRKSETAHQVYERAKALIASYDALGLRQHTEHGMNEEPLLCLAMAQTGLRAVDDAGVVPMASPWLPQYKESGFDVLAGRYTVRGPRGTLHPVVVHYFGRRKDAFAYHREAARLAAAFPLSRLSPLRDAMLCIRAYVAWRRRFGGSFVPLRRRGAS